jgi:hypothetical protein
VLGALWAGRIAYRSGDPLGAGTTSAPAAIQVAALHDTFFVIMILLALALMLGIWALVQERHGRGMPTWVVNPPQR